MEYLKSTIETPICNISIYWKSTTTNIVTLMLSISRVVLWIKKQFAMFDIKDMQQNVQGCTIFPFSDIPPKIYSFGGIYHYTVNLWKYSVYSITRYWPHAKVATFCRITTWALKWKKGVTESAMFCHLVCFVCKNHAYLKFMTRFL